MKIDDYMNHREAIVYMILNKINKKKYIGVTVDKYRRKHQHFSRLKSKTHTNHKLQRDYNKYGKSAFVFKIVEKTKNRTQAFNAEREQIKIHDTVDNGYNIKGKEASYQKKVSFSTQVSENLGDIILNHIDSKGISKSDWLKLSIKEKAKREGLI